MKLLNFLVGGEVRAGLVRDGGVEDLSALGLWHGPVPVKREELAEIAQRLSTPTSPTLPLDSLRVAPVVIAPEKIICVGLNYRRHAAEAHMEIPAVPAIFGKFANSLSAHRAKIALPPVDYKYDYEAELGVVMGREAWQISEADALSYVAGYCCVNDLSARGPQLATTQWMAGKILDGFFPAGPFLVTTDSIPDPQNLSIRCTVNGVVRQNSSTSDMIFSVATIIAFLSQLVTLKPGDIIATGTPEGVMLGAKDPEWLKAGDTVSVDIDGLGRLTNHLVAPADRR
jgi:2-keto-4-pentenoate hydratase/2-oxohepta-3-ene-1,7-dioic acid hydratase in catechol pathway